MQFDYFYGNEAEQFTFYRIPKILITSPHFKKISDSAKLLYGLMLDRMSLSIRNGWLDDDNRAYIFFTRCYGADVLRNRKSYKNAYRT